MNQDLMKEFKADLKDFREMTEKFYAKEVSVKDYKGFSGGFGSYAQKGGEASMLRLRMPGGRVTKEKLKFLVDSIERYDVKRAHLTTCQTVQFHDLDADAVCDIMEQAMEVGIVTRGGGGDFPRNTMVSPLSGVERGEYFDVLPYAECVSDYLMGIIKTVKLPRKLKVGFSNSPANVTHATFRDLGFVAREDGNFDVYSAGGLGNNARFGLKVAENVQPEKILYYICAMRETFIAHGNYKQRGRARTRYMQETLGEEGYIKAFHEKLDEVFASGQDLDLHVEISEVKKQGDGSKVSGKRVIDQKQEGLYAVSYHPFGGCPKPEKLGEIYDVIKDMDEVEARISPDETMYIINLTGDEAKKVLDATDDGAETLFETSVSCIGATICQVGLRDSQGLLHKVIEAEREAGLKDGSLPKIHISGCMSSCGTHQIGEIGFHGSMKVIDKVAHSAFVLHINGSDLQGKEKMGEEVGIILEEDIPQFLVKLGQAVESEGLDFSQWNLKHPEGIKEIAKEYIK